MSAAYVVTAAILNQRIGAPRVGNDPKWRSQIKRFRRGDVVTDLSADDIARHLKSGSIAKKSSEEAKAAKEDPAPAAPAPVADEAADPAEPLERPARAASKDVWEAYAESCGIDTAGKSKADLIEETR